MFRCITLLTLSTLIASAALWGQVPAPASQQSGGAVRGTVKDDSGGVIPGVPVTLTDASGHTQSASTQTDGTFSFRGVAPGLYSVSATYSNMQQRGPISVTVAAGKHAIANVVMTPQEQKQEVTVTDTVTNQVSTDPGNNASALVLKQEDLDALP